MKLSKESLAKLADRLGYRAEILEKVLWLLEILVGISKDDYLEPRLALKGGTALNIFVFNLPRLSVDIDLNYIGTPDKTLMAAERPRLLKTLEGLCQSLGLSAKTAPAEHAGGKWRMSYPSQVTENGNIEIDLNFLQRLPLWNPKKMDSVNLGGHQAKGIRVLDPHDLYGGKLTALLSRGVARDAFDAAQLSHQKGVDENRLRLAFVIYGAASRTDWRTVKVSDVKLEVADVEARLVPVLSREMAPDIKSLKSWTAGLEKEARDLVERILPLRAHELEFLDRLLDEGDIVPSLVTDDAGLGGRIALNPALTWKAQNVKEHMAKKPKG